LMVGGLQFVHDPEDAHPSPVLTICGHKHPSVVVGRGSVSSVRVPCFHLRKPPTGQTLLLPAFGTFTGMKAIAPTAGDRVFAVTPGGVIEVPC
jgi:metallophosphoesterase superfamily enzyme